MKPVPRPLGAVILALFALAALEFVLRAAQSRGTGPTHPVLGVRDYRGPPFSAERDPRGVRVLVVGDEWAWGEGLAAEQAWPAQLEGLFAHDGRASRVEVVNGAQRGETADGVLRRMQAQLLDCQPTWLLVSLGVREARSALAPAAPEAWWTRSALLRWCLGERNPPALAPVERLELQERVRRAQFDFGVRLAKIVEAAWTRRVYVALIQAPWPPSDADAVRARDPGANEIAGAEAARLLHSEFCAELARVAEQADVALIDARAPFEGAADSFDTAGRLTPQGARRFAEVVYSALRRRIP